MCTVSCPLLDAASTWRNELWPFQGLGIEVGPDSVELLGPLREIVKATIFPSRYCDFYIHARNRHIRGLPERAC